MLPCGVAGAVVIAGWLVEAKQSVIENIAPVLTKLFTPLVHGDAAGVLRRRAAAGSAGRATDGTPEMFGSATC